MKILIVDCMYPIFWYKTLVGQKLDFVRETSAEELAEGKSPCYFVKFQNDVKPIAKPDGKIINE